MSIFPLATARTCCTRLLDSRAHDSTLHTSAYGIRSELHSGAITAAPRVQRKLHPTNNARLLLNHPLRNIPDRIDCSTSSTLLEDESAMWIADESEAVVSPPSSWRYLLQNDLFRGLRRCRSYAEEIVVVRREGIR